ncbi:uncharacterized protein LOC122655082 [Telopea speciosissima]|uniref:uncharacterized protein LOC122655082 n=1 Tax=Telopea speciosissima TaxID=54955 RepID=UPI001CC6B64A|nr:uncharacterized protein LOC122655082 [Telopea speciosissima]
MTFVYLSCNEQIKKDQFSSLINLANFIQHPWLLADDWNSYLISEDKIGGRPITHLQTHLFKDFKNNACVAEVNQLGYPYTWNNKQMGLRRIEAKLDRFFTNMDWFSLHPNALVTTQIMATSDHRALFLNIDLVRPRSLKPFRFENFWVHEPGFLNVITSSWNSNQPLGSPSYTVCCKLQRLQGSLKSWNKCHIGYIFQQLEDSKHSLSLHYKVPPDLHTVQWFIEEKRLIALTNKFVYQGKFCGSKSPD